MNELTESIQGRIVNQRELSEIFGVTQKSLWKWQKEEGMPCALTTENGAANQYNTAECIAWYAARAARKGSETPKDRLDRLNGDLKELELAEKYRSLVPISEIEPEWTNMVLAARQGFLSLAARCASLIPQLPNADAIRDFLEEQIEEQLKKLAYGQNDETDDSSGDDVGAGPITVGTAETDPAIGLGGE